VGGGGGGGGFYSSEISGDKFNKLNSVHKISSHHWPLYAFLSG